MKRSKRLMVLEQSSSESSENPQVTVLDDDEAADDVPIAVMARLKKNLNSQNKNSAESSGVAPIAENRTDGTAKAKGAARRRSGKAIKQE